MEFLNGIAKDQVDIFWQFLDMLNRVRASYCVIGGLPENVVAEPLVSRTWIYGRSI